MNFLTKSIAVATLGVALATQAADYKSYSFLSPGVTSFFLTNAVGATNLKTLIFSGNTAAATNYSLSTTVAFMYTNVFPWNMSTYSNFYVLGGLNQTQYGAILPGYLVTDVLSNITSAAGVFGVLPVNNTNTTIAATNDMVNMFQDVIFPDIAGTSPGNWPAGISTTTTNAVSASISVSMLPNVASQSNYVTLLFTPLVKQKGPIIAYDSAKETFAEITDLGSGASVAGFPQLQPFTISFTNSPTATPKICVSAQGISPAYIAGAAGLRCRFAYVGTAAASGLSGEWIQDIRLNVWAP